MKYIIDIPTELAEATAEYWNKTTDMTLVPYTEPDRESIEDEVWGFVRIITDMTECERKECFGCSTCDLDEYMTYQEAKAKYDTWKKQKDEIRVGDEVTLHNNVKLIVVTIDHRTSVQGIDENGECYEWIELKELKKTGRHFPEVEELLKKMRESE